MRQLTMNEFIHYLILFGTQAAIWIPLMELFQNNLWLTLISWFVISVLVDKLLHKYFKIG